MWSKLRRQPACWLCGRTIAVVLNAKINFDYAFVAGGVDKSCGWLIIKLA
jgi:hypothetical protein